MVVRDGTLDMMSVVTPSIMLISCSTDYRTEGGRRDYQGTVTDTLGPDTSMRFSFKGRQNCYAVTK